jgi:hypothetical protein
MEPKFYYKWLCNFYSTIIQEHVTFYEAKVEQLDRLKNCIICKLINKKPKNLESTDNIFI